MGELNFAVPTLFGLEGLCADEIRGWVCQCPGGKWPGAVYRNRGGPAPAESESAYRGAGSASAGDIPGLETLTLYLKGRGPCPGSGSSLGRASFQ